MNRWVTWSFHYDLLESRPYKVLAFVGYTKRFNKHILDYILILTQ